MRKNMNAVIISSVFLVFFGMSLFAAEHARTGYEGMARYLGLSATQVTSIDQEVGNFEKAQQSETGTMSRLPLKAYLGVVYVLVLLSLLSFLALLQYRWTGEASLGEQQRMQVLLNETLSFMERSFDREISQAALNFWHPPQVLKVPSLEQWQTRLGQTLA